MPTGDGPEGSAISTNPCSQHQEEEQPPSLQSWKVYEDSKATWLNAWIEYETNKVASAEARWAEYERTKGDAQQRWKEYNQRSLRLPTRSKTSIDISIDTGFKSPSLDWLRSDGFKRGDAMVASPTELTNGNTPTSPSLYRSTPRSPRAQSQSPTLSRHQSSPISMRQSTPTVSMRRATVASTTSPIRSAGGFPRRATTPPNISQNDEPIFNSWHTDELLRKTEMDRQQREQHESEKMRRRAAEHARLLQQQKAQQHQEAERRRAESEAARLRAAEEARLKEEEATRQRKRDAEAAAAATAAAYEARRLQEQLYEQRRRAADEARLLAELKRQRRERDEQQQRVAQEREHELRKRRQQASRPTSPHAYLSMSDAWEMYEQRWHFTMSDEIGSAAPLSFESIPWPMNPRPTSVDELDGALVKSFILSPAHSQGKPAKQRLRDQLLRFHPDRFEGRWLSRVCENDRSAVKEGVNKVARYLNEALSQHSSL
ncbi:uncharacterized protein EI90DRAFT_3121466 [Cantharellus anzutake]|uniref:uncharacterized protein n=1 Tax=Cantharellus anzutake TaxID=1750568 RepID=UPI001906A54F|nr:uncharacterized protein EI90DRAFT_3121466 [Cantharellus anzutake]KAF8334125.1 hypothetical protein EI90DRAFT_3121466 [Cantharellus anzutake]